MRRAGKTSPRHLTGGQGGRPRRRLTAAIVLALVVLAVCIARVVPTVAYLTNSTNEKPNDVTPGTVEVTLVENGSEVSDGATQTITVTDSSATKTVSVKNTGTTSAYVRVQIGTPMAASVVDGTTYYTPVSADGVDDYGFAEPSSNAVTIGDYTYSFRDGWSINWFYYQGWFYYRAPLEVGETTSELLQSITLPEDATEVEVSVSIDAVQTSPTTYATESWGVSTDGSNLAPPS